MNLPILIKQWTSLWTAMSALAQAFGAFFVGFILDRFGRKWPAVGAGALTMVGTAVQYTSIGRGSLLAGKMVVGLGIGAAMATATSYASEVSSISNIINIKLITNRLRRSNFVHQSNLAWFSSQYSCKESLLASSVFSCLTSTRLLSAMFSLFNGLSEVL